MAGRPAADSATSYSFGVCFCADAAGGAGFAGSGVQLGRGVLELGFNPPFLTVPSWILALLVILSLLATSLWVFVHVQT